PDSWAPSGAIVRCPGPAVHSRGGRGTAGSPGKTHRRQRRDGVRSNPKPPGRDTLGAPQSSEENTMRSIAWSSAAAVLMAAACSAQHDAELEAPVRLEAGAAVND